MSASTLSPKSPRHYPTQLELFHQCRRRYLLKVVERRTLDEPFNPSLAKGIVAHDVLKLCGAELKSTASLPADLRSLVAPSVPRDQHPSELSWENDVTDVVEWVKFGLTYIDPYASILGVELFLDRMYRSEDRSAPVAVGVVVDLLLLRTDENGERFLEVIDYKTGNRMDEPTFAPVMARFALKRLIDRYLPGDSFAPVVFTELYLAKRLHRSQELTLPACLSGWEEITRTIAAIEAEEVWDPNPSPLCRWCAFNGNGCRPDGTEDSDNLW